MWQIRKLYDSYEQIIHRCYYMLQLDHYRAKAIDDEVLWNYIIAENDTDCKFGIVMII